MKCKLCEKDGVTICRLEREWPDPKPQFAFTDMQTIAECWLCPSHNWRADDINLGIRRSLLDFRIKVNKKEDSFPNEVSISFNTLLIPDAKGEVIIHRVPKEEYVEVNHTGLLPDGSAMSPPLTDSQQPTFEG